MSNTINQAIERYSKENKRITTEITSLNDQQLELYEQRKEELRILCSTVVEELKLFKLFPWIPKCVRKEFIERQHLWEPLPNSTTEYLTMYICDKRFKIELDAPDILPDDEILFDCPLNNLLNEISELKRAATIVKTYIK